MYFILKSCSKTIFLLKKLKIYRVNLNFRIFFLILIYQETEILTIQSGQLSCNSFKADKDNLQYNFWPILYYRVVQECFIWDLPWPIRSQIKHSCWFIRHFNMLYLKWSPKMHFLWPRRTRQCWDHIPTAVVQPNHSYFLLKIIFRTFYSYIFHFMLKSFISVFIFGILLPIFSCFGFPTNYFSIKLLFAFNYFVWKNIRKSILSLKYFFNFFYYLFKYTFFITNHFYAFPFRPSWWLIRFF